MRSILVLTSTYPRWEQNTEPTFVHLLCIQLARKYEVIVLAPHYPGAKRHEEIDGNRIYRFRYFIPAADHLAHHGGIITNTRSDTTVADAGPPKAYRLTQAQLDREHNIL